MDGLLVIVPCGQSKIWDKNPSAGPTPACDAYTGSLFRANRRYAETFAQRWVILSAKYGIVPPDYQIPGPYNVTFKKKATNPVQLDELLAQGKRLRLNRFKMVVGLGGIEYRERIKDVFADTAAELRFPFAGLNIFDLMSSLKQSVESNDPFRAGV